MGLPERDWKVLRELKTAALERFCQRVLGECARISADERSTWHQRYLKAYKLIRKRDRELAAAFDDLKRSNALIKLMVMRQHGLLSDEEISRLSDETRQRVQRGSEL